MDAAQKGREKWTADEMSQRRREVYEARLMTRAGVRASPERRAELRRAAAETDAPAEEYVAVLEAKAKAVEPARPRAAERGAGGADDGRTRAIVERRGERDRARRQRCDERRQQARSGGGRECGSDASSERKQAA